MNLYNIQEEYLRLMELIEDSDGEIDEHVQLALKRFEDNKDTLIEQLLKDYHMKEYDEMVLKSEIERLNGLKNAAVKSQENLKKNVLGILKFFNMRSTNKKSVTFAFKSSLFSCFSVNRQDIVIDEVGLQNFKPITGTKSEFINFTIAKKFDFDSIKKINETKLVGIDDYTMTIDKAGLNKYYKDTSKGLELQFDDKCEIVLDPLLAYVSTVPKESLTIK